MKTSGMMLTLTLVLLARAATACVGPFEPCSVGGTTMAGGCCSGADMCTIEGGIEAYLCAPGPSNVAEAESTCSLYGILGTTCIELDVDCKYAKQVIPQVGLLDGTCEAQGYTVKGKSITKNLPVIGAATGAFYTKPTPTLRGAPAVRGSAISSVGADAAVQVDSPCHFIEGDACNEASETLDCGLSWEKHGTCTASGYTTCCEGHEDIQLWYKPGVKCTGRLHDCPGPLEVAVAESCREQCKDFCCKNNVGDTCVLACGCTLPCPAQEEEAPITIVQLAAARPELSTLVTALKAAGLVDTLSGKGPFTVFAPTNAAFNALPDGVLTHLLIPGNKASLVDYLTYHVLPIEFTTSDIIDQSPVELKTVEGKKVSLTVDTSFNNVINAESGHGATVTSCAGQVSNGIIHIIDAVLLPSDAPKAQEEEEVAVAENLLDDLVKMTTVTIGGQKCQAPGNCGFAYKACCFGSRKSGHSCDCHLQDADASPGGNTGPTCGNCGVVYAACCAGFKTKGFPCTCDVSLPSPTPPSTTPPPSA